jgi:hypothetical protein
MNHAIEELLPEVKTILDEDLRLKVIAVWNDALRQGGWTDGTLAAMPCSLFAAEAGVSFIEHVRTVCQLCIASHDIVVRNYGSRVRLDRDALVAGALLADVGKLIEYECRDGKYQFSERAKHLRHPFSGVGLGWKHGVSEAALHVVATHSKEGDHVKRSAESIVFHHADFISFDLISKGRPF